MAAPHAFQRWTLKTGKLAVVPPPRKLRREAKLRRLAEAAVWRRDELEAQLRRGFAAFGDELRVVCS